MAGTGTADVLNSTLKSEKPAVDCGLVTPMFRPRWVALVPSSEFTNAVGSENGPLLPARVDKVPRLLALSSASAVLGTP